MRMVRRGIFGGVYGAALACAVLGQTGAQTLPQSVAQVGGPAQTPPAGYDAPQFIDSRGCVFVRAVFGGQVNWVARIGPDRKPICNPPAAGLGEDSALRPKTMQDFDPSAAQETVLGAVDTAPVAAPCPASAPVLQEFPILTGGAVQVCTRGDGSRIGWVSPRFDTGALAQQKAASPQSREDVPQDKAPDGGAAQGRAEPPAPPTAPPPAPPTAAAPKSQTLDPISAPEGQSIYVQVGAFALEANAKNAAQHLKGMGLPVAFVQMGQTGAGLMAIMAGPFDSLAQASEVLDHLRREGFSDAFLRKDLAVADVF